MSFELIFISGLHVGFVSGNITLLQLFQEGGIHGGHSVGHAAFDDASDITDFTTAYTIRQCLVLEKDFIYGNTTSTDFLTK